MRLNQRDCGQEGVCHRNLDGWSIGLSEARFSIMFLGWSMRASDSSDELGSRPLAFNQKADNSLVPRSGAAESFIPVHGCQETKRERLASLEKNEVF
jgi:hypothetical protein